MSWQVCPLCKGEGKLPVNSFSNSSIPYNKLCTVCRGMKVISEITGLPPQFESIKPKDNVSNI